MAMYAETLQERGMSLAQTVAHGALKGGLFTHAHWPSAPPGQTVQRTGAARM